MSKIQALFASVVFPFVSPLAAYSDLGSYSQLAQASPNNCADALQAVKNKLEEEQNVTIEVRDMDVARLYSDYPSNRSVGHTFVIKGSAAPAILNSPQLLQSVSKNIINICKSVSAIEFAEIDSDYAITFGLVGDTVKEFRCQDYDTSDLMAGRQRPPLVWGEQICL